MHPSPHRRLADTQNFLWNPRLVERLLDRSTIGRDDLVLEIGPGKGIITAELAVRTQRVVAIEKDVALVRLLRDRFAHDPRVTVHAGDFLQAILPPAPYKVFANLPFNITADVVRRLTDTRHAPVDAFLAVQREAAQRFLGQPRESLRSVLLKPWFEPTLVHRFQRVDFIPPPQVEVVMLRLRKRGPPLLTASEAQGFRDFVVYAFSAWQPSVWSALRALLSPRQLTGLVRHVGCPLDLPPTEVAFEDWLQLYSGFSSIAGTPARRAIQGSEARLVAQQAGLQKVHRTRRCATRHRHVR